MSHNDIERTVYFSILTLCFSQTTVYFQRKTEYFSLEQCDAIRVGMHLAAILYVESVIPDKTRVRIHLQSIIWAVQKTVHFTLEPKKDCPLYTTLGPTVHNSLKGCPRKPKAVHFPHFRPFTFVSNLIYVFPSLLCFQVNYYRNITYKVIGIGIQGGHF